MAEYNSGEEQVASDSKLPDVHRELIAKRFEAMQRRDQAIAEITGLDAQLLRSGFPHTQLRDLVTEW